MTLGGLGGITLRLTGGGQDKRSHLLIGVVQNPARCVLELFRLKACVKRRTLRMLQQKMGIALLSARTPSKKQTISGSYNSGVSSTCKRDGSSVNCAM